MDDVTKRRGRPSDYNPEIATIICNELAGGASLRKLCAERDDFPGESTVFQWLAKHKDFAEQYARAREAWADAELENILAIADDKSHDTVRDEDGNERPDNEWISRSRLRVDTRKWALGKLAPKKYGDKFEQTLKGDPEAPIEHNVTVNFVKPTG